MGIRPTQEVILDMPLKLYDLADRINVWTNTAHTVQIGTLTISEDGEHYQVPGFIGSRQACLEQLVRRYRISSPGQVPAPDSPPPVGHRKTMTILGESLAIYAFLQTPTVAVWTEDKNLPLGILFPDGELWRRSHEDKAQTFEACLESMVRELRKDEPVTCV